MAQRKGAPTTKHLKIRVLAFFWWHKFLHCLLSFFLAPFLHFFASMKVISLQDVLAWMDTGKPFDIAFVTADRKRQTGGEIIELENVKLHRKAEYQQDNAEVSTAEAVSTVAVSTVALKKDYRNPQHLQHGTRNLRLSSGKIRKIHIRLIVKFNGAKVVY